MTGYNIEETNDKVTFNVVIHGQDNPYAWMWELCEYLGVSKLDLSGLKTEEIEFYLHEIFG